MNRTTIAVATLVLIATSPAAALTPNVVATPVGAHIASTTVGADSAFVATVGYGHALRIMDRTAILQADVTLPWSGLDLGDYRLRVGALVPVVSHGAWRLLADVTPLVRGVKNPLNRMTNIGLDTTLVGGYYGQRWFGAVEVGVDWALLTRIDHTRRYRRLIYADARDGWYRSTGATVHLGLMGGYSFEAFEIVARLGQQRTQSFESQLLPLYFTLGVNVRL